MENKKLLADLLAAPGKVRPEHVPMLKEVLKRYPYAQPVHLLLARAEAEYVPKAALYSNGRALYEVLEMASIEETVEEPVPNPVKEAETATVSDDQEIFEEISEHTAVPLPSIEFAPSIETPDNLPGSISLEDLPVADDLFIESVAATDFFAFEQQPSIDVVEHAPEIETVTPDEPEVSFISKYDDDNLPYTFLWWLAKTRKEHEQIFRPYAQQPVVFPKNQPQKKKDAEAFQQQYVEHIFHIQTPFEVADHLAEYPDGEVKDVKGAEIIEKFLKEDPSIRPPKPEQIDAENKAKKSAEDHYDLVSETLAKIYIEQMLYHKAIDTYKKLSLKYPEKSRYFADLIQSIEKKL